MKKYGIWTSIWVGRPVSRGVNWLVPVLVVLATLCSYWLGRSTHRHSDAGCDECLREYDAGFRAGVLEATTKWSEWK